MSQTQATEARRLNRSSVALALLFGILGTVQYHSSQIFSGFDRFFGDRGDVRGFLYYCEHWYRSLSGKASLLSPAVFYPAKGTLAYSDLLLGVGVPYSLFRALGFDMFVSLELVMILIAFLSYCACFWLLYKTLGLSRAPAIAGAMFFAFNSPKFFQLIHLQLQFVVLLPVMFALIISFARQVQTLNQKRAALLLSLAAACFALQLATGFYFAWFFVLWSTFFLLLACAFTRTRRFIVAAGKKYWRAMLVAAAVLIAGVAPTLMLYLPLARQENFYNYQTVLYLIPDWRSLLSMGAGNYLWGRITLALMPDPIPGTWGELQVGFGLFSSVTWIALIVATVWLITAHRKEYAPVETNSSIADPRQFANLFLAIMILASSLFYVIGFRYGDHSPWYFIYRYFPGGGALRGVSRYVIFLALPMSIAFACVIQRGLEYAARQQSHTLRKVWKAAVLLLGCLIVFEQFGIPKIGGSGFWVGIEKTYLHTIAARLPPDCEAFYLAPGPFARRNMPEYQYDAMLLSVITGVPTLNASSSQFPPGWDLYTITHPDYEAKVKGWIASQKISGKVCRLETGPEIDAFDKSYPNPINDSQVFVRQLFRDFTGEQPKLETILPYSEKIRTCKNDDEACGQAQTALGVFLASGFHERGFFILRMYEAGLNRLPSFDEFTDAMNVYRDQLVKQPPELAERETMAWLALKYSPSRLLDWRALTEQVDSDELINRLRNQSFVALHYYGFLRRQPDPVGLASWTDLLNRRGDLVTITDGFITSAEYRQRLEVNSLNKLAFDRRNQGLSDPLGPISRQHVFSSSSTQSRAGLFGG